VRWRHVFLVVNTLATVVFWYMTYDRISRAPTTTLTPTEFNLFSVIMIAWGLFFSWEFIARLNRFEKAEASRYD
jgi:hypothetical protein